CNESGEEIDFTEALNAGTPILAPDNPICEPPSDCRNCAKQNTCPNYEEPEDDEEEEEEEIEESEEENGETDEDETTEQQPGDTEDDIDRKFLRALKLRRLERQAFASNQP